jgi:MOSC domain-containing protein YiiM
MATVIAVCISEQKGLQKKPVDKVVLKEDWGIEGDAHAGKWHRQVSLLGQESVDTLQGKLKEFQLKPGDFAENILVEGICLYKLPVGTILHVGNDVVLEVTQIGKECHQNCAIREAAGDCVMPREGIFTKVITGGEVKAGDELTVVES